MGVHNNVGENDMEQEQNCREEGGMGEEEDEEEGEAEEMEERLSRYELERQQRIQQNAARLAALKLPSLASSLVQHHRRKLQQSLTPSPKPSASPRRSKRLKTNGRKPAPRVPSRICGSSEQSSDSDSHSQSLTPSPEPSASPRRSKRLKTNGRKPAPLVPSRICGSSEQSSDSDSLSGPKEDSDIEYRPSDNESDSESENDNGNDDDCPKPGNDVENILNGAEDDEDIALQQALALSMGASMEDIIEINAKGGMPNLVAEDGEQKKNDWIKNLKNHRGNENEQGLIDFGNQRKRRKQSMKHLVQLSEDEVNALFLLFDERGRGKFSVQELERVAYSHDFTWTKEEIFDMIDIFDNDKDGQLDITEFRSMANCSNMIKLS